MAVPLLTEIQEGWLAENAVSEEDKLAADRAQASANRPDDPMQWWGLSMFTHG
jgi:hypothetical protein